MTTITLNSKLVELFNIFQSDNWFYCAPIYTLGDEHFSLEFSWLAMKDNQRTRKNITAFFETSPNGSIYFYIEHGVDYLDEDYNDWEQAEYEDVLYKTIFDENGSFEKSEFYSFLKENGTKFPDEDRLRLREYYTLIVNEINKNLDSYFNLGNLVT